MACLLLPVMFSSDLTAASSHVEVAEEAHASGRADQLL